MRCSPLLALGLFFFLGVAYARTVVYSAGELSIEIKRSSDQGNVWESVSHPPQYGPIDDLTPYYIRAVWRTTKTTFAVGGFGALLRSSNGKTWSLEKTGVSTELNAIWGDPKGGLYIVGAEGVILFSDNDGKSWQKQESSTTKDLHSVWGRSAEEVYISGDDSVLLRSTDRGKTWVSTPPVTDLSLGQRLYGVWGGAGGLYMVGKDGLLLHSQDAGKTWRAQTSNTTATLRAIWGSAPENLYAVGDAGTILRSQDAGKTWSKQESPTKERLLSIWGSSEKSVFALSETSLFRSVDGASWQKVALPKIKPPKTQPRLGLWDWLFAKRATPSTPGQTEKEPALRGIWGRGAEVYLVGKNGLLLHSKDGGKSWKQEKTNTAATLRAVFGLSNGKLFAVGKGVLLRSTDGGASWEPQKGKLPSLRVVWGMDGVIYAAGNKGALLRSKDEGASWESLSLPGRDRIFGLFGDDAGLLAVGESMVLRSEDGAKWSMPQLRAPLLQVVGTPEQIFVLGAFGALGSSKDGLLWSWESRPENLRALWVSKEGELFGVGEGGLILHSTDGKTWRKEESNTDEDLCGIWGSAANDLYAVGDLGLILRSSDNGKTWREVHREEDAILQGVWGSSAKEVYAFGDLGVLLRSVDQGKSWKNGPKKELLIEDIPDLDQGRPNAIWWHSKDQLFLATDTGTIFSSSDGGKTFARRLGVSREVSSLWGSSAKNVYAVGAGGLILHSVNGGQGFREEKAMVDSDLKAVWGSSAENVFAVGDEGVLLRSTDGKTWRQLKSGTEETLNAIWGNKDGIFVAGDGVVLRSLDGESWQKVWSNEEVFLRAIHGSSSVVVAVGNESVVRSLDQGVTWEVLQGERYIESVWVSASGEVYAIGGESLLRSLDGGKTWEAKPREEESEEMIFTGLWGDAKHIYTLSWIVPMGEFEGD